MTVLRVQLQGVGVEKFCLSPCPTCGTPKSIVNGAWLRNERKKAGLSLREMARRLGVSAPFLCDVEFSRRNCSVKVRQAYEALK